MLFLLYRLDMEDYIDFLMLNVPEIDPTYSWHIILYIHCWVLFANILLRYRYDRH